MQEEIISESLAYLQDFKNKVQTSNTLVKTFISYDTNQIQNFQKFIFNIKQSFQTLADQLEIYAEEFYNDLAKTPEENEVDLFHYNQLSNSFLNISHSIKDKLTDLVTETIEPFQQFASNFEESNKTFTVNFYDTVCDIEASRQEMLKKQEDYLKLAHEFDKKKDKKSKKNIQLQKKCEENLELYRSQMDETNKKWNKFNQQIQQQFEGYDLNEQSRSHMIQLTVEKVLNATNNILSKQIFQKNENTQEKLNQIKEKQKKEQVPLFKIISRNRRFNILKVTKREEFISFENWKDTMKHTFDGKHMQRVKVSQSMSLQIEQLIKMVEDCTQEKQMSSGSGKRESIENDQEHYDLDSLFRNEQQRQTFLQRVIMVMDEEIVTKVYLTSKDFVEMSRIARSLVINLQKENQKKIEEFKDLVQFVTFYGRKNKLGDFESIGSVGSEKTSLFFERDLWQDLLINLNERENLEIRQKQRLKISGKDLLGLLLYNRHKNKQPVQKMDKIHYLKELQNIQRICQWMILLNLKIDFAGDTIILLSKQCDLRVSDIVILLEQFETLKIVRDQTLQQNSQVLENRYKKNKFDPDQDYGNKQFYAMKKSVKYLSGKDQINLLLVNRRFSRLKPKIIQKHLCYNMRQSGLYEKRKYLWIKQLDPYNLIKIDYYELKEKYSRQAGQSDSQSSIETLIAQDVQRSFNTQGMASSINHLTLHNLLKLYAYYNPTISYIQGMNFIMGFFYFVFEDEELTFRCFASLMQQYLKDVLMYDLQNIRVYFYKLDRLLQIYLPDISQHLKQEKIESGHYSAPWFITFFTGSFAKNKFSDVLYEVWDILLSRGWCGFYQILIAIFSTFKQKIIKMRFDQLLQFLNNLVKCEFFGDNSIISDLKKKALQFNISQGLLNDLDKEYYMVRQKINKLMNY